MGRYGANMGIVELNRADAERIKITKEAQIRIQVMYKEVSAQLDKEMKNINNKGSAQAIQLKHLKQVLNEQLTGINDQLDALYKQSMYDISDAVVQDMSVILQSSGLLKEGAMFANVSQDVVEMIVNGSVYDKNWVLSDAIWGNLQKNKNAINEIIAKGVIGNKSTLEIAKELEQYVNLDKRKQWDWNKVNPLSNSKIDYNAQRLARTLIAHAYQESVIQTVKNNPFTSGIKWRSANISNRTCTLCRTRDGNVYQPDELPLDHPNGLCTMLIVTDPLSTVADRLANWVNGGQDSAIDKFAKVLYPNNKFIDKII